MIYTGQQHLPAIPSKELFFLESVEVLFRKFYYFLFLEYEIFPFTLPIIFKLFLEPGQVIFPYLGGPLFVQFWVVEREMDSRFERSINCPHSIRSEKQNSLRLR